MILGDMSTSLSTQIKGRGWIVSSQGFIIFISCNKICYKLYQVESTRSWRHGDFIGGELSPASQRVSAACQSFSSDDQVPVT